MADASPAPYDFSLNPAARMTVHHVGAEREPVLVIDDLLRRPESMIDYAEHESAFGMAGEGAQNFYPGVQTEGPPAYVAAVGQGIHPVAERIFGLQGAAPTRLTCKLSLVTLAPDRLNIAQRLPHVDNVEPLSLAFLHYFCDERFGGTAFYRHRATGFETLTPARRQPYLQTLNAELGRGAPPAEYVVGDTPLFAQTAAFEARFNRALVYRTRVLHSSQINPAAALSDSPRTGRLTANIFLAFERG